MRSILILIVIFIFLIMSGPMIVYWWGRSNVSELPRAVEISLSVEQKAKLWEKLGGSGEPKLKKLNPYSFIGSLICIKNHSMKSDVCSKRYPGLTHASIAIRGDVGQSIKTKGNLEWHVTSAAYTIWATRVWSIDKILGKVSERNL